MNPIAYRVVRAPVRSIVFALLALLALMHASGTIDRLTGPAVSSVLAFLLIVAAAGFLAFNAWYARDHRSIDPPLARRMRLGRAGFLAIAALCGLAALSPVAGPLVAIALAGLAFSLRGVHEDATIAAREHRPLLTDSQIAQAI
ncbi:hypothetical protein [Blastococcus sp. Marseille-P5729]|uniref:hypothetical protein n=1 Tax=Blastococcus sp. Marseille-P5729 TaxID=2086582 RepID=UPI000D0F0D07|nr:hypothetical protein [Blastococcus sp. Marseille-P5729]